MEFDYLAYIEELKDEVEMKFDKIITAANNRMKHLLDILTQLADKFRKNRIIIEEELERLDSLLEESNKTTNLNEFDEKVRMVQEKRESLTELTHLDYVCVKWDHKLLDLISDYGNMSVERGALYSSRFNHRVSTCLNQSSISLLEPDNLAIDSYNQELYVLDSANSCVFVFSREGEYIRQFGQGLLSLWGGMDEPKGISIRDKRVFVTQSQGHCLKEYNLEGTQRGQVGSKGNSPRQFNTPIGIDTDTSNIFVCDCHNNRIQVLDYNLKFVRRISGVSLNFPRQLRVLDNRIFVLSLYLTCIQEIDKQDGSWIRSIITLDNSDQVSRITFSFDRIRNLFLCNPVTHSVSVFSHNNEQLLHTCDFPKRQELLCVASLGGDVCVIAREKDTYEVLSIRI
ncbi:Tripartite motif-containing protein 2-like [Oopsacas minuta]|uniref:Tripartite motif-containing protein 2-like n=1 Tax=Oopsacas minuta TaxID=111878 RepID=A0AAV7K0E8_9METZ|nr:Tripartite motif-containing protein 2-like [Oopsacas minuta]